MQQRESYMFYLDNISIWNLLETVTRKWGRENRDMGWGLGILTARSRYIKLLVSALIIVQVDQLPRKKPRPLLAII